ncbi:MAG: hypothetical protein ABR981_04785 [Candidatus Micrarchaeaceae archaeon]
MTTAKKSKKIKRIDLRTKDGKAAFEKARKKWERKLAPLMRAAEDAGRITEDDLRIVINARAD